MSIDWLSGPLLQQLNSGVILLNTQLQIVYINPYICRRADIQLESVQGKDIFSVFTDAPKAWLSRKLNSVLSLQSPAFSSWEQRQYLFKLPHLRPVSSANEYMAQNCNMLPLTEPVTGEHYVCLLIEDATDAYVYQNQLQQSNLQLQQVNRLDGLTGVLNRNYWQQQLEVEVQRAARYQHPLSLLFFDLDKFKRLNDDYGHQAGDLVLIEVAKLIGSLLRETDLFGRYGGEEFAIILPDTPLDGAIEVAKRICRRVAATPIAYKQQNLMTSVSVGVSQFSSADSADDLIQQADLALYQAKRNGRNQVVTYYPGLIDSLKKVKTN
ncbi:MULTISPECIES: sensor domain-containing diguanylate cyclase [unclassified Arsukibacterium]|uniref:sensor domain-containing diguanylate cyclase n=1 Tax=unclassified Arsukibacterium TaxID=2635278 RepID=UPI000C548A57|nr:MULTISPECIES: sensor domain-containing diguanylate cyclase [unclassified Arsukibacterium]MAA96165.1 GGDEF domain-containing protein [Rheinheimera sp.]MBM34356.1 GGDEF domain-containing protein [Rheinheimera sp.]|tara:strand:+ start:228470 stop:229441 length:972 start_codon:yes stop_codon:yes gene_type:complete